jgi:hypothetical protein
MTFIAANPAEPPIFCAIKAVASADLPFNASKRACSKLRSLPINNSADNSFSIDSSKFNNPSAICLVFSNENPNLLA